MDSDKREFIMNRSSKIIQRAFRNKNYRKYDTIYSALGDFVWVFQGMKICEGYITQNIIYETIKNSEKYCLVEQEYKIPLQDDSNDKKRKYHKVDIFGINNKDKIVDAFNSKGKSFNNTISQESELYEYNNYKRAIQEMYPEYKINYMI